MARATEPRRPRTSRTGLALEKHLDTRSRDSPCGADRPRDYLAELPARCQQRCDPRAAPAPRRDRDARPRLGALQRAAQQAPDAAARVRLARLLKTYVARKFRTLNFGQPAPRAALTALPHWAAVDAAGVSRGRVRTLEGKRA